MGREEARRVVPLVEQAQARQIVVGAICDASAFLGAHGFLNDVDHTSNGLTYLQSRAGSAYSGAARYRNEPSVRDGNLVTANGVGFVDFTCNMLSALKAARQQEIEAMRRRSGRECLRKADADKAAICMAICRNRIIWLRASVAILRVARVVAQGFAMR